MWNKDNVSVGDKIQASIWGVKNIDLVTNDGVWYSEAVGDILRPVFIRFESINHPDVAYTIIKTEVMKKYEVSEDFIKEAHKAACQGWKTKIEKQFPDVFPKTYKIGQKFEYKFGVEVRQYILACTGDRVVHLINLATGDRRTKGVTVKNLHAITESEFRRTCGIHQDYQFTLIKD